MRKKSFLGLVAGLARTASSLSIGRQGVDVSPTRRLNPLNVEQAFRALENADATKPYDFLEDEEKPEILPKLLADLAVAKDHFFRDGGPVVIAEGVPEEAISYFVEMDEARAVAIDFRRAHDGWLASLVKMEGGRPHATGVREAAKQLGIYADSLVDDGVEPELLPGAGLLSAPGGGAQLNPDANVCLDDDGLSRFFFELDHKHNDPGPQVTRVDNLFTTFGETLRNVVTVKVRDRHDDDRFPGFAVHYRRDDDNRIHVVRACQTGTANYGLQKKQVREAWDGYGFILDPAVDDGSDTGFRLENDNLKLNVDRFRRSAPLSCRPSTLRCRSTKPTSSTAPVTTSPWPTKGLSSSTYTESCVPSTGRFLERATCVRDSAQQPAAATSLSSSAATATTRCGPPPFVLLVVIVIVVIIIIEEEETGTAL